MTIDVKAERIRGRQEASRQFAILREKWPLVFPIQDHKVRPLASEIVRQLMDSFGWSNSYTRGVLLIWKTREAYCRAILRHTDRITLDGKASGEKVDDKARALAQEELKLIAARKARKAEQQRVAQERKELEAQDPKQETPTPPPAHHSSDVADSDRKASTKVRARATTPRASTSLGRSAV